MAFTLPTLAYAYDALAPYIDARTMEIHHSKHHQAYIHNLQAALDNTPFAQASLEEILPQAHTLGDSVRNNAGGHYNHSLFWQTLTPQGSILPQGSALYQHITATFGSLEACQEQLIDAGMQRFGSGWAWLIYTAQGDLRICSTANQDNPLMAGILPQEHLGHALLGLDVWEHAYYLSYQNRRKEYLGKLMQCIHWQYIAQRFDALSKAL